MSRLYAMNEPSGKGPWNARRWGYPRFRLLVKSWEHLAKSQSPECVLTSLKTRSQGRFEGLVLIADERPGREVKWRNTRPPNRPGGSPA